MDFETFPEIMTYVGGLAVFLYIVLSLFVYPCMRSSLQTDLVNQMKANDSNRKPSEFVNGNGSDTQPYYANLKSRLSYEGINNLHTKVNETLHQMKVIQREGGETLDSDKDY